MYDPASLVSPFGQIENVRLVTALVRLVSWVEGTKSDGNADAFQNTTCGSLASESSSVFFDKDSKDSPLIY